MATDNFSKGLPNFSGEIENPVLRDSLIYLEKLLGSEYRIVTWSDKSIAIPISISVDLPSLGNYNNIDIQSAEPVLIVFDIINYPTVAPIVFTDRIDFPKDKLAHLYIAKNDRPPGFCYVRGNSDEWYANKRIQDLIIRIGNWLRDAASGELSIDGSQFEPLRLEGYNGTIIYDYDLFADIVTNKKSLFPTRNWTIGLFEKLKTEELSGYKFIKILTLENVDSVIEEVDNEKRKDKEAKDKKYYYYGYILWSESDDAISDYEISLPTNWESFKIFCEKYNINCDNFEDMVASADANHYIFFPVIVAIKRPSNLIGFNSNIEFVNFKFKIDVDDVADRKIVKNIPIVFQSHNQPLTRKAAQVISGSTTSFAERSVIFGCGALGSKIATHFGRSGLTSMTLIDPDHLSPHNLVRHALTAEDVGVNKAAALTNVIKKIFPYETTDNLLCGPSFKDGIFDKANGFEKYKWVFDFTASEAFFHKLVLTKSMNTSQICSASISDFGNLGILLKEGPNRNPRIDDLQASLYSQYKSNKEIIDWLRREYQAAASGNLTIQVGVGCNSETTILSDDKVSSHSAFFAGTIKHQMKMQDSCGKIILNRIIEDVEYKVETDTIKVDPFDVITAINAPEWSIRFKSGILNQIKKESKRAKGKETGGVFIGIANYKTKTIHVTDLISAPPDSKANSVCFYRGHKGLPEQINKVTVGSGSQLGYIGEWHSHPLGPNGLSDVDMESIRRFQSEFAELITPLPVFLTVVAPAGVLPFVY